MCKFKIIQYLKCLIVVGLLINALLITSYGVESKIEQNVETQKKSSTTGFYKNYYEGALNNKYKISMVISLEDLDIKGYYSYRAVGKPIDLDGHIEKGAQFIIKESVDKKITGEFRGKFTSIFDAIEGQWSSPDGKKQMPFKLKKIAEFKTIKLDKFDFEIEYPQFLSTNNKTLMRLNNTIDAKIQKPYKDVKEYFSEDNYEVTKNYTFKIKTIDIAYFSKHLVSILLSMYEFTGGQGMSSVLSYNFRLNNDSVSEIKLSDLFEKNSDYLKILSDLIASELENQWGWNDPEDPVEQSFVEHLAGRLDDTIFIITPRGLKFFFKEMSSMPAKPITVPYKGMEKIIPPDSPLPYRD